jgi:hypothetical protein
MSVSSRIPPQQTSTPLQNIISKLKYSRSTLSSVRGFAPVITGLDYGKHVYMRPVSRHSLLPPGLSTLALRTSQILKRIVFEQGNLKC